MTNTYYVIKMNGIEINRVLTLAEAQSAVKGTTATYKICYEYRDIDNTAERRERIAKNREQYYKKLKEKKNVK